MDIEAKVCAAAFLGAATGLPAGFLLVESIRYVVGKLQDREQYHPAHETMTWALRQPGVRSVQETQVGANWVRTYNISGIYTYATSGVTAADEEKARVPIDLEGFPGPYIVQVIGVSPNVGNEPLQPFPSAKGAALAHANAVADLRRKLGLRTPI